jgi:hypothetical protein
MWAPQSLTKEFRYKTDTGDLSVETSPIKWKDDQNLVAKVRPLTGVPAFGTTWALLDLGAPA